MSILAEPHIVTRSWGACPPSRPRCTANVSVLDAETGRERVLAEAQGDTAEEAIAEAEEAVRERFVLKVVAKS